MRFQILLERMRAPHGASLLSILLLAGPSGALGEKVDFAREVLPILSNKCFVCHGPDTKKKDQLRLDSYESATADRDGFHAIDPKDPSQSEILVRLHDEDDPMPPKDAEKKLTDAERKILAQWVKEGGTYAKHWSFVAPVRTDPPKNVDSRDPIDRFVEAKLKEKSSAKVSFAPEADRATLARRAALTLTGLPPEPAELAVFLADNKADAYLRFLNKLMQSPRYGEHQARYWLDAVRYGDTHGLHLDNKRGIYPYRDWVVRAFNKNLPLNDFILWQLAGDLLPNPTVEQNAATGFVRMNPSTAEGGAIPAEFQCKNNFDRTETLGTVLLGMTMTCARCHTHKYDPITQTEYYQLLAFFNSTSESPMDGNRYEYGPVMKVPADQKAWDELDALVANRKALLQEVTSKQSALLAGAEKERWGKSSDRDKLNRVADPKGPFKDSPLHSAAIDLSKRFSELEKRFTPTLVARELGKPRATKVLVRGEYNLPIGEPVQPGIPSVMGSLPENAPRNRLGLAQWLTSRDNPLVARVLVNRIWQRVFGEAIVRSPEDFGLQGKQPTHPELLDWLAVELQESGWNLQHILRLMLTSRTFKQQSAQRADTFEDPENLWYSRGPSYRLDAEVIRDMALWSSRLLDGHMGGEGVKPYQPAGLWKALMHPGSNTKNYVADKGTKLYRRSLYVYWKRTSPHPMMILFDAPDRESSCVRRSRTNTSLQSLGLLNETQRIEMARMIAERLITEAKDDDSRMDLLFTLVASRPPNDTERKACDTLLEKMQARYQASKDDALALLSTGEAPRNEALEPAEVAAWTQISITVLASDVALLLY
ncbi:MAG: PSD1 and planctomycete cytochrome C domain-containing protein [Roseibacillus sp.]|nr:PSD1 and planctomycete cytochrome C domain-containing protein [Roseibacillus sp.]